MNKIEKINIEPQLPSGNSNIIIQYEIQKAAWVWHPLFLNTKKPHVLKFNCEFETQNREIFDIHVSADHRYELYLDGEIISRGPDRSDLAHWSFSSYNIELPQGKHEFQVTAWWIAEHMPAAQITNGHGGFIFSVSGNKELGNRLNTGCGDWLVREEYGWSFDNNDCCYAGSMMNIDAAKTHFKKEFVTPKMIYKPIESNVYGEIANGWNLYPSSLPDQMWNKNAPGRIKATLTENNIVDPDTMDHNSINLFQQLLKDQIPVTIKKNHSIKILWDLENYYCAYPELVLTHGKNATVKVSWAEGLFEDIDSGIPKLKGNRDEIINKRFFGKGDCILLDNIEKEIFRPLWWRSGRYILIEITTDKVPLIINSINIIETRYPIKNSGVFNSSDKKLNAILPLAVRGIEMCSHETFMDCPYYEQLMYVGDTRLEILTTYCMTNDTKLIKRGIELFDWSRYSRGFIHERYPSTPPQISLTFSLIWVAMLNDFAWWRDDRDWLNDRLIGMRSLLEHIIALRNLDGLLENLPGWSFIDWSVGFKNGMPLSETSDGISSVVNLFFLMALKNAAEIEDVFGNKHFKNYYSDIAEEVSASILNLFWDEEKGLIADDKNHESFSEHAQCLALLNNVFNSKNTEQRVIENLLSYKELRRVTVYFSFYLMEVLVKFEKIDELFKRFDFWKELIKQGFKTPIESPEPSRSDCHAWGSHPLFHFYASLAGIKPNSYGFKTVLIKPQPGKLTKIEANMPHPKGIIKTKLNFTKLNSIDGVITLPSNITGKLIWNNREIQLYPGKNII